LYSIREATKDDVPEILEQLKAFSEFYKTKMPMYRDDQHSEMIINDIIDNHYFNVATEDKDGASVLVGFIAGFILPHVYNPDIKVLHEAFWWVKPEHRRSGIGIQLLEVFTDYGKKNCNWTLMTLEDHSPVDHSLLTDRGYRVKETNFIMESN